MGNFFINIFDFLSCRKPLMWLMLVGSIAVMAIAAMQVSYVEDITSFFPKQQQNISHIFDNLKAKDKFVVMFSSTSDSGDLDELIEVAEHFKKEITAHKFFSQNAQLTLGVNDSIIGQMSDFVYDNLPIFMDEAQYKRLDSLTNPRVIAARMEQNYNNLLSPIGGYIADIVYKDPLGLGGEVLKELQNMGNNFNYKMVDDYIFSKDEKTLICYIQPYAKMNGGDKDKLIDIIENSLEKSKESYPTVLPEYFGADAVASYNARQIKFDSMVTLNIAILIVVVFLTLLFRNKYSIFLVLTPPLFGALFALSLIYLLKGSISLIAVGSGSIIFGIAFSYSIHMLSHSNHCTDMRQLIRELAYPLTIGSITTIGAFAGLLLTNSMLLQDFGLFSALTLIGTTLFALIFLPHFLNTKSINKSADSKLLDFVYRVSNTRLDRNRPLILLIVVTTLVCALFFNQVSFDSNMMKLNYNAPHLQAAELRLNSFMDDKADQSTVLFISSSEQSNDAAIEYNKLCSILDSLQAEGDILSFSSVRRFVVSDSVQRSRLDRWNSFWTPERRTEVMAAINSSADQLGFDKNAYVDFESILKREYHTLGYDKDSEGVKLFQDWISPSERLTSFIAQVKLTDSLKSAIYDTISAQSGSIAVDRSFFASKMAEDVSENFYLILYISGFLIFFVLLLSYGRLELALMAFMPMLVSWVIILGVMSILGIEFNIVTIILSTFIFGIGDDFSIFIIDGLQSEYRDRTNVLQQHNTAIFFSAFAIVVGMGALMFAEHPAMKSLGIISLVGIIVVVLVSYTIQPYLFRALITSQSTKGGFPYTIMGLLNTIYAFGLFLFGCFAIQFIIGGMFLVPISRKRRKGLIRNITSWSTHAFLKAMVTTKMVNINQVGETFKKPAIIIANHQSFIDILILLGLHRKLVMVTNGWVWRSPFFGKIVRYLDFYHTENGYQELAESLRDKVNDGYSVIVFPEGTRSPDNQIKRFHKGAFYLAEYLKLDILPILIYGNGLVSSKRQPLYIKHGLLVSKILPRIAFDSAEYGEGYKARAKSITRYFKAEYHNLYEELNRTSNPYFRDAIIKNYTYKGPVLEWYMRVKLRMEKWYDTYDRLLPRQGHIVDLGCGYGAMSYMVSMLSDSRRVTGIDYDQQKIALANNCFSKNDNINFIHADICNFDIPAADGYVISDVLHYIDRDSQNRVVQMCIDRMSEGGVLLIRDGDSSIKERHTHTEQSEKWSTRIIKFNKTKGPLCFLSKEQIENIAQLNNMSLEIVECNKHNSNTLFVLKGASKN
ncbi:MAG: 1-acyl-sn-glycerol-3-phosphate acyltransferase [Mucinivorans sp.]